MSVTVKIPSRISNAIIFVIVDIIGLWSVHRCLKGLQSCYFYRSARSGRTFRLARSRIPILSGELLQGATRTDVIFVIANAAAIILAFLATLEVNGETLPISTPVSLTNVATIDDGTVEFNDTSNFYSTLNSCATRNSTHFGYWPVAYSIDLNNSIEDEGFITPMNPTCQEGAPGFQPLIMVECITLLEERPCNIYDRRPGLAMNATIIQSSFKNWSALVSEFMFTDSVVQAFNPESGSYEVLSGKQGFTFVFREPILEYANRNTAIVFLDDRQNDSWYFTFGELQESNSTHARFGLFRAVRLTPSSLLPNRANAFERFRTKNIFPRTEVPLTNIPAIIEFLFTYAIGSAKLTRTAYSREPKDVTVISTAGLVFYGILITALIVLFFLKELLVCCLVYHTEVHSQKVFATEFDQLSKNLRRAMEREQDMAYSNGFTLLGVQEDLQGGRSVCPVLSTNQ